MHSCSRITEIAIFSIIVKATFCDICKSLVKMNGRALVAVILALMIAIDDSNQLTINNNNLGPCEKFEMEYIACINRCMINTRGVCNCIAIQDRYKSCWQTRERVKAQQYYG